MAEHKVISSDGHVVEPPNLWTERMDPKLGDLIPRLVEGDSIDQWHCGDQRMGIIRAAGANTGMRFERPQEMEREGKFADVRLGGYDPHVHIKDIEIDGVHATMIFPTIARQLFSTISDYGLAQAVCVAYNDWLAEFCKPYPNRLKGVPMILLDDVEGGIAELKRTAKLGLTGAMISNFPPPYIPTPTRGTSPSGRLPRAWAPLYVFTPTAPAQTRRSRPQGHLRFSTCRTRRS